LTEELAVTPILDVIDLEIPALTVPETLAKIAAFASAVTEIEAA
jgi:hypothetical protein